MYSTGTKQTQYDYTKNNSQKNKFDLTNTILVITQFGNMYYNVKISGLLVIIPSTPLLANFRAFRGLLTVHT